MNNRQATVFRDVTVQNGAVAPPRLHQTVVVTGESITWIGSHQESPPAPIDATIVDGTGHYLIPGLVDAHVHFLPRQDIINRALALALLAHGVTTVYCMAGYASVLRLRAEVEQGTAIGPRILSTGPIQNDATLSYDAGRRRALDQARRGYDAVKVYNELPRHGFEGLCAGAERAGIAVVGHVVRSVGAIPTLSTHQSMVAHAEELLYTHFDYQLRSADDAEQKKLRRGELRPLGEQFAESGTMLVATLQHFTAILRQAQDSSKWFERREMTQVPRALMAWWRRLNLYGNEFSQPFHLERLRVAAEFQLELVRKFHEAGVTVLAGTDALVPGSGHGFSLHDELEHFVHAGLSPADAISAASDRAAASMGVPLLGRVELGAPADLILLAKDPQADIKHSRAIVGVMARGIWRTSGELDRLRTSALASAEQDGPARIDPFSDRSGKTGSSPTASFWCGCTATSDH